MTSGISSAARARLALVAFASFWLAACGGGGGGSATTAAPAPLASAGGAPMPTPSIPASTTSGPAPSTSPSAAPAPAATGSAQPPAPTPGATPLSASTVTARNGNYDVVANAPDVVDISLALPYAPGNDPDVNRVAHVGDTLTVHGIGTAQWRIKPGFTPPPTARSPLGPIYIDTSSIAVAVAAGQVWTPNLTPRTWHWMASDPYGRVLVAAENPGRLWVSTDAGVTWDATDSPVANWVGAAVYGAADASDRTGRAVVYILAAAAGGGLYESAAGGTWTPVEPATAGVDFTNRAWASVAAMYPENALAAVFDGPIYRRPARSAAWSPTVDAATGQPLVRRWQAVALSGQASGPAVAVAVGDEGQVWISDTNGDSWVRRDVSAGGTAVTAPWSRAAIATDASVIAVAGDSSSSLYLSRDHGLTWTRAGTPVGDYTSISVSGDGRTIMATLTAGADGAGSVQISRDSGLTFAPMAMPGSDTHWTASTVSADANFIGVAAGTSTAPGQLYTSIKDDRVTGGALIGGQGSSVELVFEGLQPDGERWRLRSSTGSVVVR